MDGDKVFCEFCGRRLRFAISSAGFAWMECPKWPRGFWEYALGKSAFHTRYGVQGDIVERLRSASNRFDAATGRRL